MLRDCGKAKTLPHVCELMNIRAAVRGQSPGVLLLLSTVLALIWANSRWSASYDVFWQQPWTIGLGSHAFTEPLLLWINDGLMALFFFVVGLEIKAEILSGKLSSLRKAALPLVAAGGGMILPATFYLFFNFGTPRAVGWGIPMATDLAFAVGVLTLLGDRIPPGLKVFVAALAIMNDIVAVTVIALFYSSEFLPLHLAIASAYVGGLLLANRLGIRNPIPYALVGIAGVWHCFFLSGIHPTVAGILLALTIPSAPPGSGGAGGKVPLQRIHSALGPWVTYLVLPLFALANAGVSIDWDLSNLLDKPVALGVMTGLILGKQIGVFGSAWLAVRLSIASLPSGVSWRHLYGASWLAGVGFTMSLLIASLAFYGTPSLPVAKSAVLLTSLFAGLIGWLILRWTVGGLKHDG